MRHAFSLYTFDIRALVAQIQGADSASFDMDDDGNVIIYVAGKEPLHL